MPAPTNGTPITAPTNLPANSNNSRQAHIRKFCACPPERGARLVLRTDEHDTQLLGEWTRDQCVDSASVPVDVDQTLQDHARATRAKVTAHLEWLDEAGERVTGKLLNHAAVFEPGGDEFDQVGPPRTDSEAAHRAMVRMLLAAQQTVVNSLSGTIRQQNEHNSRQQEQIHARDLEIERMRASHRRELERLEASYPAATEDPEGDARRELLQTAGAAVGQALPVMLPGILQTLAQSQAGRALIAMFMGGGGSAPSSSAPSSPPPSSPPPSSPAVAPGVPAAKPLPPAGGQGTAA